MANCRVIISVSCRGWGTWDFPPLSLIPPPPSPLKLCSLLSYACITFPPREHHILAISRVLCPLYLTISKIMILYDTLSVLNKKKRRKVDWESKDLGSFSKNVDHRGLFSKHCDAIMYNHPVFNIASPCCMNCTYKKKRRGRA